MIARQRAFSQVGGRIRYLSSFSDVDICIVGGGIVGSALANAIASSPVMSKMKVALIDGGSFEPVELRDNIYSNRVSSITPSSKAFIDRFGVWDSIPEDRKFPYQKMHIWESIGSGKLQFNSKDISQPAIAHILENTLLKSSLTSALNAYPKLTVCEHTRVESIERDGSGNGFPVLKFEDGSAIRTRLLVGADGLKSKVREFAGIETKGWDYAQKGVVSTLKVEDGYLNGTAWQRFLPDGPIALLPLNEGYVSLVWTCSIKQAEFISKLSDEMFLEFVNIAVHNQHEDLVYAFEYPDGGLKNEAKWGLQGYTSTSPAPPRLISVCENSRNVFPLKLRNAERYIDDRIVLIGDAAHSIHPLAGQGLNLGLGDAECLARVLEDAVKYGQEIGAVYVLEGYARERYTHDAAMLGLVHSVGSVFGGDSIVLGKIRSVGMNLFNESEAVKV